ncbi:hypothetical protein KIN20_028941 [Parelaphostrongylus tenuis]|uniref:Peptidase C1A papain C-terminal domain-containing protein n=1 Tax=Parelaphostrongylus tenuis TaxID=148309 RepID=A0AAD5WFG6_PARTN|nr:hypothetical protein KIN20_028941 [Parelaphostrongylus tenuis]
MKIMSSKFIGGNKKPRVDEIGDDGSKIPDSFDARVQWPHCPSISYIRDQSQCGSCWAFASAEAMSDRVCIASHGNKTVELSADDILSCCYACGLGCYGGYPIYAWQYFVETGVVTGGLYGTKVFLPFYATASVKANCTICSPL